MKKLTSGSNRILSIIALLFSACSGGCGILGTGRGPVPPPVPKDVVVAALRERADHFFTVKDGSASLLIQIQTGENTAQRVSLGAGFAFDRLRPGLWLLADKVGQEIFTLRANNDRFWLELPRSHEIVTGGPEAYYKLPYLIYPYEATLWFGSPEWLGLTLEATQMHVEPEYYTFDVYSAGQLARTVMVDRRTLTVTAIAEYDLLGRLSTEVLMSNYGKADSMDFPFHLTVTRPLQGCSMQLRLGSPKFNQELKAALFEPKDWTDWRHVDLDREPLSSVKGLEAEQ